jgi:hypothetical protein
MNATAAAMRAARRRNVIREETQLPQEEVCRGLDKQKAPANGRGCNQEEIYDSW